MTAFTRTYKQADTGNLNKYLSEKIKSAAQMAGEERKYYKENSKDYPVKPSKGYFFGKALAAEFGGDKMRRMKGTFSSDPSETEDPTLSKRQRFSNLIRGEVQSIQPKTQQLELPLGQNKNAVQVEDKSLKSWLSIVLDKFERSNKNLEKKIEGISIQEKEEISKDSNQTQSLKRLFGVINTLKNYFNKNNKLKEEENSIEAKQLEFQLDTQNNIEMNDRESNIEGVTDVATSNIIKPQEESPKQKKGGGLLSNLFGGDLFDFDMDRRRKRNRGGSTPRRSRRNIRSPRRAGRFGSVVSLFENITNFLPGRSTKLSEGGVVPQTEVKKLSEGGIVSSEPQLIQKLSEGGYNNIQVNNYNQQPSEPRTVSKIIKPLSTNQSRSSSKSGINPPKMSAGGFLQNGLYTNPTVGRLSPGQAVIPLNRNNPVKEMFSNMKGGSSLDKTRPEKGLVDKLAEGAELLPKLGGGWMITLISKVFNQLGGLAPLLKPFFDNLLGPLSKVFGLPSTIVTSVFGGTAEGSTLDSKGIAEFLMKGKKGKRGSTQQQQQQPPPQPPGAGGADLGATMVPGETIQAQAPNDPGGFIQGGSGRGSETGYDTHFHLTPPSNDPAGWQQARAVAYTAVKMMHARGSTVYFGNIKEDAVKDNDAALQQQIVREQIAHTQPGRTQGGIDMQERNSSGSFNFKFPLQITNLTNDINNGGGRTARIKGTNVRLAHGAAGSANSIESAVAPQSIASPSGNTGMSSLMFRPATPGVPLPGSNPTGGMPTGNGALTILQQPQPPARQPAPVIGNQQTGFTPSNQQSPFPVPLW